MANNEFPIEAYLNAVQQKRQAESQQGSWASALGGGIGAGMMDVAKGNEKMRQDAPAQRAALFKDLISKNILQMNGQQLGADEVMSEFEKYRKSGQLTPGIEMIAIEKPVKKTALFDKSRQDKGLPAFLLGDTGQYAPAMPEGYTLSQMGGQGGSAIANDPQYKIFQEQENKAYQALKDINQGLIPGDINIAKQKYKDAVENKNKYLKSKYGTESTDYETIIEGGWDTFFGNFGGTPKVVPVGKGGKTEKGQGKLMVDKNGNRAMVYPDGTIEEVK